MPVKLHRELAKRARELKLKGDRKNAYIYGTLHKIEKTKKREK